ncbi:MAG: hypothetical protein NT145_02820 [Elusimicrobia bacterium]|nr:hypothetical protein [Elusimicrobiota bacterium]
MKRNQSKENGQALIENILLIPIIVVVIVMIFWFAQILLTRQQLLMGARYGSDLILYTRMNETEIRSEVIDYLCGKENEGRVLDKKILENNNIEIRINRDALNPLQQIYYGGNGIEKYSSYVKVAYDFDTPKLFSAWSRYIGGGGIIKKLKIGARSEVLAGTGCKGDRY